MGRGINHITLIISHNARRANLVGGVVIILARLRLVLSHHLRPYVYTLLNIPQAYHTQPASAFNKILQK